MPTIDYDIRADARRFNREVRSAEQSARRFGQSSQRSFRGLNTSALGALTSVTALAAAFTQVVRTAADFEQSVSNVAAVTRATAGEFQSINDEARRLGSTTRFSASQAAAGMEFLARAGFSVQEAVEAASDTLLLAQSSALELGQAADIASNVLSAFALDVDELAGVVDVLALGAASSNTNVEQLGEAMRNVGPIAAALGISVSDTVAALGTLGNAGIQASLAGTSLRATFASLASATPQTEEILRSYGLTLQDVDITTRGFLPVMDSLFDAGITVGDAFAIFGRRAAPAFLALRSGRGDLSDLARSMEDATGTAREMARVMDDNLQGSLLRLRSRWEELQITLAEQTGTRSFIDQVSELVSDINDLVEDLDEVADVLNKTLEAVQVDQQNSLPGILERSGRAIGEFFRDLLGDAAPVLESAARSRGGFGASGAAREEPPVRLVEIDLNPVVSDRVTGEIENFFDLLLGEASNEVAASLGGGRSDIDNLIDDIASGIALLSDELKDGAGDLVDEFDPLGASVRQAEAALENLRILGLLSAEALAKLGVSTEALEAAQKNAAREFLEASLASMRAGQDDAQVFRGNRLRFGQVIADNIRLPGQDDDPAGAEELVDNLKGTIREVLIRTDFDDSGDIFDNIFQGIAVEMQASAVDNLIDQIDFDSIFSQLGGVLSSGLSAVFGGVGGLFGSLFGGQRQTGGRALRGQFYEVGEFGRREFFAPDQDGTIFNERQAAGLFGGRGGDVNISIAPRTPDEFREMLYANQEEIRALVGVA